VGKGIAVATGVLTVLAAGVLLALQHSLGWLLLAAPLAGVLAVLGWLAVLWQIGSQPYPTGAGTDLPAVLKALHVQQRFALLAAELQGADASTVHARFGDFLSGVEDKFGGHDAETVGHNEPKYAVIFFSAGVAPAAGNRAFQQCQK